MKKRIKRFAEVTAILLVLPAVLVYQLSRLALSSKKAFPGWSQAFSLIPGLSGVYLRRAFYRMVLTRCGRDATLCFGSVLSDATEIGCNVYVGIYCCLGDITLEDDVLIGSHVSIINGASQHGIERLDIPVREQPGMWPRINVGRDSWIGDRAVIMANVGKHCVVGAGSVVTKAIPDYAVAVGVPAKVIRYRDAGESETEALPIGEYLRA